MENFVVYPQSWTSVKGKYGVPSIQCIGYYTNKNSQLENIYIRFPIKITYILKYMDVTPESELQTFLNKYDASKLKISEINPSVMLLRDITEDLDLTDKEIIESVVDPYGELFSFFQATGILPYKPFMVMTGKVISVRRSTNFNIELLANELDIKRIRGHKDIQRISNTSNNVYWDIETINPKFEFPDPSSINDHIICISIIHENYKSVTPYFLYWGSYDLSNIKNTYPDVVISRSSSEKNMIMVFFDLLSQLKPDTLFTFNGDTYDIPYLIKRVQLYDIEIPNFTKLKNVKVRTRRMRIKGSFKYEYVDTLVMPGINNIDLIQYFRRKYLYLPNYKLNTISNIFLGEQKSDIDIRQMMMNFYIQSPEGMEQLGQYSIKDSLLLYKLATKLDILNDIQNLASKSLSTIGDVINMENNEIINRLVTAVDFGAYYLNNNSLGTVSIFNGNDFVPINNFRSGLYNNVYVYDYTNLYSYALSQEDSKFGFILSKRSYDIWPELKSTLYWSKYVDRNKVSKVLDEFIGETLGDKLLEINYTHIYTFQENLDDTGIIKLDDIYNYYLSVTNNSYIYKNISGNVYKVGTIYEVKPDFKLSESYLNIILNYLFGGADQNVPRYNSEMLRQLIKEDISLFRIKIKIKDLSNYKDETNYRAILAKQYGKEIKKWTGVEFYWIRSNDPKENNKYGYPILVEKYESNMDLNIKYYLEKLNLIYELTRFKNQS